MSEIFSQNPNVMPVVRVKDGAVFANSRDIAALFGKQHKNVLQKYDALDCSEGFRGLNFKPTSSLVEMPNGGVREERSIDMTRDGFCRIIFGFTGARAGKFIEDYIAAYNAMEAEIQRRPRLLPHPDQEELELTLETHASIENIEKHMQALHAGLAAKMDVAFKAIVGATIKNIAHPILNRVEASERESHDRFKASFERDRMIINSLKQKRDAEDCVSIAVAQTMVGVPTDRRSSRLSMNLAANARHWFAVRGYTTKPDSAHAAQPWIFQRSKVAEWWAEAGRAIYDREMQRRSAKVVSLDAHRK